MSSRNPPAVFDTAREIADTRNYEYPIERDQTARIVYRRYHQNVDDYVPMALDTEDDVFEDHFLVSERIYNKVDKIVWFERAFATIPATRDDPQTYAYTFPGYETPLGTIARVPFSRRVTARLHYEYFLNADPTDPSTGIASVLGQHYVVTATGYEAGYVSSATTPTLTTYDGWVSAETEVVADDSYLEPYRGNIWARITPYVIAQ